jgi:hypothetical protein
MPPHPVFPTPEFRHICSRLRIVSSTLWAVSASAVVYGSRAFTCVVIRRRLRACPSLLPNLSVECRCFLRRPFKLLRQCWMVSALFDPRMSAHDLHLVVILSVS